MSISEGLSDSTEARLNAEAELLAAVCKSMRELPEHWVLDGSKRYLNAAADIVVRPLGDAFSVSRSAEGAIGFTFAKKEFPELEQAIDAVITNVRERQESEMTALAEELTGRLVAADK